MFNLTHTHKISALRWRELQDDHFFLISFFTFIWLSPFFGYKKKKKTGRQDDLSGSHSHCRSVRLSLLVFTSCHTDLASEALAPAWSLCANCTAPSLWMRLLCHVTSAALCIRQIHWSCSFCQFIKSGCFCSAFFLFFFPFFSTANLNNRAVSLAKNV